MVSTEASMEEASIKTREVSYETNPTVLYKLIESKHWDAAVARVQQAEWESGVWVSRHGKDGRLRWKILPLHAAICLKAPKEVLLQLLNAYPQGVSSADDQGMLPLHLALRNDEVDNTFLLRLLNMYPNGIQIRDKRGRVPLEMRGRAIFDCWQLALDTERRKIKAEEKKFYESKLSSEKEILEKEITKLQNDMETLTMSFSKQKAEDEDDVREEEPTISMKNDIEESPKYLELRNISKEQKEMIDVQVKELATQGELIKKLRTQIDVQEEHLRRIKTVEKARGAEYVKLKESTQNQRNEMNTQMETLKEQEAIIKSRKKEVEEKSAKHDQLNAELIICKEVTNKLKEESANKDKQLERKEKSIAQLKEELKNQKIETKKYKDSCEVIEAQVGTCERKVKNLTVLNENYRKSLDEMTVVVNDSVLAMQRMTLDRTGLSNNFFDKDAVLGYSNNSP